MDMEVFRLQSRVSRRERDKFLPFNQITGTVSRAFTVELDCYFPVSAWLQWLIHRIYTQSGKSHSIQHYYGCYDPLQYLIIFPYGQLGWHQGISKKGIKSNAPGQPRFHVGVYLSEGDAALSVTLFSPDAEKLIQYSAGDLKTSDEKNISMTKEIDLATRNKEVLCFLKCLDGTFQGNNVRTYLVLKKYLKSELTCGERENTASIGVYEAGTSSAVAALEGDGTKEFFTPTIKSMLDEIHAAPDEATHSVQSTAVKRPLNFAHPQSHSGPTCNAPNFETYNEKDIVVKTAIK